MRFIATFFIAALLVSAAPSHAQVACCATQGGVTSACSPEGRIVCGDGTASSCVCSGGLTPGPTTLGQLLVPFTTAFGDHLWGSASAVATLTITNYGSLPVTVTSVTSRAPNEFIVASNNCGVVAAGKGCTVGIVFKPAVIGARTAFIDVVSTGVGSPQSFLVAGNGTAATAEVVEYFHSPWNHYFITNNADEIAKLDNGTFAGWKRTGQEFTAYALGTPGVAAVCRFFSTAFDPRSSHFYTGIASECAAVKANPSWAFEGEVFGVLLPSAAGACPGGTVPLYRLYNAGQGAAPNHRYTTDLAVRNLMLVFGWISEGYGATGVIACVPPNPAGPSAIVPAPPR
jgi:hypothetical protein